VLLPVWCSPLIELGDDLERIAGDDHERAVLLGVIEELALIVAEIAAAELALDAQQAAVGAQLAHDVGTAWKSETNESRDFVRFCVPQAAGT